MSTTTKPSCSSARHGTAAKAFSASSAPRKTRTRRPCVVRILTRLNVGGPTRHAAWLTAGVKDAGFRSVLLSGSVQSDEDDMGNFAAAVGVRPLSVPPLGREISWRDALAVWRVYRLLARMQPDLVHTHTAKAGAVGRMAGLLYRWLTPMSLMGRPRRCRVVHTYHGHIFHSYYGRLKTRLFLVVERLLARLATDRIVVISPRQYREIHETYRVGRAEQFAMIPLGLDVSRFADWPGRRGRLREELRVDATDVLVGIVGRLTDVKNHRLFLEAAARYKRGCGSENATRVRFVVIGNGRLRDALQEQARRLGLANDVTFLGLRDDPEDFYPGLDIVGLTSLNEGTPLTIIEAMANARPVIATAVGGVVDLLGEASPRRNHGDHGVTVRRRGVSVIPNDPGVFCRGLERLVQDPTLRRSLGTSGRIFVEQNHSKDRLVEDVVRMYGELLCPRLPTRARQTVACGASER